MRPVQATFLPGTGRAEKSEQPSASVTAGTPK